MDTLAAQEQQTCSGSQQLDGRLPSSKILQPILEVSKGLRIGVVGCGYWGSKHIRVLHGLSKVKQLVVIEQNLRAANAIYSAFPDMRMFPDLDSALHYVDAVVIATPPRTHREIALRAIERGKHVLIEKPLATSYEHAQEIVGAAQVAGVVLMVGHTFQFSPAVRLMHERLRRGEVGRIHYIHSARLNLGLYRPDVNVVWDLAPHDLSIMNYLLGSTPAKVAAWGASIACPGMEDLAYVQVEYRNPRVTGYIHLSWLDPRKTRTVTIVGSKKMMTYDDLAEERVRIYDKGLEVNGGTAPHEWPISYRYGDITSPHIQMSEPLALQDGHFVDCILGGCVPESDGRSAMGIVATLEAIDRSLRSGSAEEVDYEQELSGVAPGNSQMAVGCMPE